MKTRKMFKFYLATILFAFFLNKVKANTTIAFTSSSTPSDPPNAVRYNVFLSTVSLIPDDDLQQVTFEIQQALTIALSSLRGFSQIQYLGRDNLRLSYRATFVAEKDGNFFRFPLPEAINSTLESAASVIDYQIPGTNIIITEDSNDVEFAVNSGGLCSTTSRFCTNLYGGLANCVDVGTSSVSCVCYDGDDTEFCQDLPSPPITPTSLRYEVTVTIDISEPSQEEIGLFYRLLRQDVLVPALSDLNGYTFVQFSSYSLGSLITTSLAEFRVDSSDSSGNLNLYPTSSSIRRRLRQRATELNYLLTSVNSNVTAEIERGFEATALENNGLCGSSSCPTPPTGFTASCLEIGTSTVQCFCVSTNDSIFSCDDVTTTQTSTSSDPSNAVRYNVFLSTVSLIPDDDLQQVTFEIQQALTIALSSLRGFSQIQYLGRDNLRLSYLATFMADIDGNFFRFPLPEAINSTLESAASVIDYQIPGTNIIITEDSNDVEFAVNSDGLCSTTSRFCTNLYGGLANCVDVGTSSVSCVCYDGDDTEFCQDLPSPPITPTSLRYEVTVTIDISEPSQEEIGLFYRMLRQDVLVPGLSDLNGYTFVQFSSYSLGSLITTSLAEFRVDSSDSSGNLNLYPTSSSIRRRLRQRATELNYLLTSVNSNVTAEIKRGFEATALENNGLCGSSSCPTPPTGFTTSCLEIGTSTVQCFCVSTNDSIFSCDDVTTTQTNTSSEPPATNNSLIGIIAGVVGGVVFLIIVVIIVVCCLKKKRSKSTKPRHSIGNESNGYIDAKDIDNIPRVSSNENVYMEIKPDLYGQYLELDKVDENTKDTAIYNNKNTSGIPSNEKYDKLFQEHSKPPVPGNHPTLRSEGETSSVNKTRFSKIIEGEDGYLTPTPELKKRKLGQQETNSYSANSASNSIKDVENEQNEKKESKQQAYVIGDDVTKTSNVTEDQKAFSNEEKKSIENDSNLQNKKLDEDRKEEQNDDRGKDDEKDDKISHEEISINREQTDSVE